MQKGKDKTIPSFKSMKSTIIFIVFFLSATIVVAQSAKQNDSPYSFLGDKTTTLDAEFNRKDGMSFDISREYHNGDKLKAHFDYINRIMLIKDMDDHTIKCDTLSLLSTAYTTMDPMTERYPHISPYAFCANNPIMNIYPSGMVIEDVCSGEWGDLKYQVENERNKLVSDVKKLYIKAESKGWSASKLASKVGDKIDRIMSLTGSIETMDLLENSTQV